MPSKAVTTDYGILVTLPETLFIDSFPTGDFFTFEFQLLASAWNDTTRFPCQTSQFEPSLPACDYYLHGWQTAAGQPHTQLQDTAGESSWGTHAHSLARP